MNDLRMVLALFVEDVPRDVHDALSDGRVRSGIEPLSVQALYLFEQRLPADIREAGARFVPGVTKQDEVPPGFRGTVDDAFGLGPQGQAWQMTGRFIRVDLSLPNDVLLADLQQYLIRERSRLAAFGGPQPYREAAGIKHKPQPRSLRTMAGVRLLQFLDLDRWQRAAGKGLGFNAVRGMADCNEDRADDLRRYVVLAMSQMKLHAWFARLDRSAKRRPTRGGFCR